MAKMARKQMAKMASGGRGRYLVWVPDLGTFQHFPAGKVPTFINFCNMKFRLLMSIAATYLEVKIAQESFKTLSRHLKPLLLEILTLLCLCDTVLQTGIPNFSGFRTVVSEHNVQYGQMRYQTIDLIEFHENKLYQKLSEALVRYYDTEIQ